MLHPNDILDVKVLMAGSTDPFYARQVV